MLPSAGGELNTCCEAYQQHGCCVNEVNPQGATGCCSTGRAIIVRTECAAKLDNF